MTAGSTPKHTRSLSESICMPKRFSRSVRSMVEATFPSNMSQTPETMRHSSAHCMFPPMAKLRPRNDDSMPR